MYRRFSRKTIKQFVSLFFAFHGKQTKFVCLLLGKSTARQSAFGLSDLQVAYRMRARGLYTFYPLFELHLCTVTFGLVYG